MDNIILQEWVKLYEDSEQLSEIRRREILRSVKETEQLKTKIELLETFVQAYFFEVDLIKMKELEKTVEYVKDLAPKPGVMK